MPQDPGFEFSGSAGKRLSANAGRAVGTRRRMSPGRPGPGARIPGQFDFTMGPIMQEQTLPGFTPVSEISTEARAKFISNTYGHVAAAILLFTTIEMWLFSTGRVVGLAQWIMSFNWLIIIGALMLVSWGAT